MVVNENLQQVFDPDNLLRQQLQILVLLALEHLAMSGVVNHRLDDPEGDIADVFHRDRFVVILAALHRRERSLC